MDAKLQDEIIANGWRCLARMLAAGPASRNDSHPETSPAANGLPDAGAYAARIEKLVAVVDAVKQLQSPSSELEHVAAELERAVQEVRAKAPQAP